MFPVKEWWCSLDDASIVGVMYLYVRHGLASVSDTEIFFVSKRDYCHIQYVVHNGDDYDSHIQL